MADQNVKIVIKADNSDFKRKMQDSGNVAQEESRKIQKNFAAASGSVNLLKTAFIGLAASFSVRELANISDTYKNIEGRLKLVTQSSEELTSVNEKLFNISQQTRNSYESTVELFARFARSTKHLGVEQSELLKVTETVNQAVVVSGASAASASAAIFQLSQGLAANALRGQELNSVLEQTPRLAEAIANGMGVQVGELRKLAEAGALTADAVLTALSSQADAVREEFAKMPKTIGQSLQQLENEFLRFVGTNGSINTGSQIISEAISTIAENLDLLTNAAVLTSGVFTSRFVGAMTAAAIAQGNMIAGSVALQLQLGRMSGLTTTAAASLAGFSVAARGASVAMAAVGGPIGLAFLAVMTAASLHTNEATEAQTAYNQELADLQSKIEMAKNGQQGLTQEVVDQTRRRIEAHIAELESLDKLIEAYAYNSNRGLLGDLGMGVREGLGKIGVGTAPSEAIAKAYQLSNQIKKLQGILNDLENPTSTNSSNSTTNVNAYNKALEENEKITDKVKEKQEDLKKEIGKVGEQTVDTTKIIQDRFGDALESAAFDFDNFGDTVRNIMQGLARDLARQNIIDPLTASIKGGFESSGIFSGIGDFFGGFFANGGNPPVGKMSVVGERGPEIFVPKTAGTIIPNHALGGNGGNVTVNVVNNSSAQVGVAQTRTASGVTIEMQIDELTAKNIMMQGTRTNTAINAVAGRTLTRR